MKFQKDPDKRYRALPFWSLNGKLDENELKAQIRLLKSMGFGGAFIHSRTGLATEYMGDEWLRLVRACAETFAAEGMDAWLYDEDRWPSGTCGGYVTEDPRYRLRFLSAHIVEKEQFDLHAYGPEFVRAFAVRLGGEPYTVLPDNMPAYSGMRLIEYFPVSNRFEIPDGFLGMIFTVELMQPSEFYNDFTYVDTMSRAATERFIELTHEKYRASTGDLFGSTIKGIFTDEPHRGPLLNGFAIDNENALRMLPYTDDLFPAYARRFGEELREKLPELYFRSEADNFSRTEWRYVETAEELFLANFAVPVKKWCDRNKLILTGHILHEDTLSAQTSLSGSMMRFYEHMTYPGIDNLGSENTCFPAAIAVSSAAKQTGKKFVLSELYGCTGWKTTFQEYKQMGDWQAACGINVRCPHLSWYTMKGEAKRDYPASIGKQASWRGEYHAVEDYFARLGKVLTECKPLTQTLMLTPVESAWGLTHMGTYVNAFGVRDPEYAKLESDFKELTEALVYAGVDFDYGDEEMMGRLARVGRDEAGAFMTVGKMKYRRVILPAMITVRSSTLALLEKFIAEGGDVSALDALPTHIDGMRGEVELPAVTVLPLSRLAARAAQHNRVTVLGDGKFFGACKRGGNDEFVYFAVNADRTAPHEADIVCRGLYNVEKFDLRQGTTEGVAFTHGDGNTTVRHTFAPSEEILLHFTEKKVVPLAPAHTEKAAAAANVPVPYRLGSPNVLVLDRAVCHADGAYFGEEEILRLDRKLRDKFGLRYRGGTMVQLWYKEKFQKDYDKTVCKLTLEFAFDVAYIPEDVRLMAENVSALTLTLNGKPLTGTPAPSDIDACFSLLPVPVSLLQTGRNVLRAEFDFGDAVDLENLYLLGSFGVEAGTPCRMVPLPETLAFGDLTTQGFPFYAGDVTYLLACEAGEYEITVPNFYAACLKTETQTAAFAPFVLRAEAKNGVLPVTAVLTPKNMFGPLHEFPAWKPVCSPDSFHTCDTAWTDEYALLPQGIFAPPLLAKVK